MISVLCYSLSSLSQISFSVLEFGIRFCLGRKRPRPGETFAAEPSLKGKNFPISHTHVGRWTDGTQGEVRTPPFFLSVLRATRPLP